MLVSGADPRSVGPAGAGAFAEFTMSPRPVCNREKAEKSERSVAMTMKLFSVPHGILVAGLSALAFATPPALAGDAHPAPAATSPGDPSALINESLISANVYTADGGKVGEVEDIVRGNDKKVIAIRLSIGGILGLGARHVMVRPEEGEVHNNQGQPELHLNITEAELQKRIDKQSGSGGVSNTRIR
jgi:sporulation protein YlmC with PRC-barrel domain